MVTVSELLKEKQVTAQQIVRACGVTEGAANKWLRGENVPNSKYLKKLSEVSNIRYSRLVNSRNNEKASNRKRKKPVSAQPARKITKKNSNQKCDLLKVAIMYAELTTDEKVVVGLMADALALLPEGGK